MWATQRSTGAAKIVVCLTQGLNANVGNVVLAGGTAVAADDGAATLAVPIMPHARCLRARATFQKGPIDATAVKAIIAECGRINFLTHVWL